MTFKIGIVCEGVHDVPILEEFVTALARKHKIKDAVCVCLQPSPDATTGSRDGGSSRVIAWCKAHAADKIATYLGGPLFEGQNVFDLILIHLDGDTIEECAKHSSVSVPKGKYSAEQRVGALNSMISEWLAPAPRWEAKLKRAIPTLRSESWLLAALADDEHDWERVSAKDLVSKRFRDKRLAKGAAYSKMAVQAAENVERLRRRCVSFLIFSDSIFA